MKTRSIAFRLALTLTLGNVALLLLTAPCGHVRELNAVLRSQRRALCEMVAISSSVLAGHQDWTGMERNLREIAARHPDMVSARIRRTDGRLLATTGTHASGPQAERAGDSTAQHMRVPILAGDQAWGVAELRFADRGRTVGNWWQLPLVRQALCVAFTGGAMLFLVFAAVLRRLDPTAALTQLAATRAELAQAQDELRALRALSLRVNEDKAGPPPWLPAFESVQTPRSASTCELV